MGMSETGQYEPNMALVAQRELHQPSPRQLAEFQLEGAKNQQKQLEEFIALLDKNPDMEKMLELSSRLRIH